MQQVEKIEEMKKKKSRMAEKKTSWNFKKRLSAWRCRRDLKAVGAFCTAKWGGLSAALKMQ